MKKIRHDLEVNGDRQRESLLAELRDSRSGLDTNELAARVGLHANTVRWHLGVLAGEGFVRAVPERASRRGRPRVVYRLTGEGVGRDRDDYRLLATILAGVVAADRRGRHRVYDAGVRWGHDLHAAEPAARVTELLDREGFEAEEVDGRIEMRRCPFYALADSSPAVVCTLHQGIIDGALAAAGTGEAVDRLEPFVEPSLCVAHLRRPA